MDPTEYTFRCPECGGSHFGSVCEIIGKDIKVKRRDCHDEFQTGCKWKGMDADCMVPRQNADLDTDTSG